MSPGEKKAKGKIASPRVEALANEALEKFLPGEDLLPLGKKVSTLSPEEQTEFFLLLLRQREEEGLRLLESLAAEGEELAAAVAESLGHWGSPRAFGILERLAAGSPSKPVLKAIRKSRFRLKSIGLSVPEIGERPPAVYHPPRLPSGEGFLSAIDAQGGRLIWLAKPQMPKGVLAINAMLSDSEGILDYHAFETSRRGFRETLDHFQEHYPLEMVAADPAYCQALILEGAELTQKKGKAPPAEFSGSRSALGPAPSLPLEPLIYRFLNEEEAKARTDLLERSAALLETDAMRSWFLSREEAEKYFKRLQEANTSPLVLTPLQKESRTQDLYRQAVSELFDEPRRLLYRRRLEEMAYFFWKKGMENEARMSLAAAAGMEKESGMLSTHPFLMVLVKRSLALFAEEEERKKKEKESELIVKP